MFRFIGCLTTFLLLSSPLRAGELDAEYRAPEPSKSPAVAVASVATAPAVLDKVDLGKGTELDSERAVQAWRRWGWGGGWGRGWGGWGWGRGIGWGGGWGWGRRIGWGGWGWGRGIGWGGGLGWGWGGGLGWGGGWGGWGGWGGGLMPVTFVNTGWGCW